MLEYTNCKKATSKEILNILRKNKDRPIISFSGVELTHWINLCKEAKKRKIGPYEINVKEAAKWKSDF